MSAGWPLPSTGATALKSPSIGAKRLTGDLVAVAAVPGTGSCGRWSVSAPTTPMTARTAAIAIRRIRFMAGHSRSPLIFSLPQAVGGSGWGLFSPPHDWAKLNRLAPTLALPRLGGGNRILRLESRMRLTCESGEGEPA